MTGEELYVLYGRATKEVSNCELEDWEILDDNVREEWGRLAELIGGPDTPFKSPISIERNKDSHILVAADRETIVEVFGATDAEIEHLVHLANLGAVAHQAIAKGHA